MNLLEAKQNLEYWYKCDIALSQGKSMTINGRSITLPSADEISQRIQYWERKVQELENKNGGKTQQSGVALVNFNS